MSNTGIPPDTDGQLRRTASALHSFNRFEIKYLQVVKVHVPAVVDGADEDYADRVDDVLIRNTDEFEQVSMETIRGGALIEMTYTVRLKKGRSPSGLLGELREVTSGQRVTVLTGYDQTDL
jgi:hypothetical protein